MPRHWASVRTNRSMPNSFRSLNQKKSVLGIPILNRP
jgi:hypothetical protein